MRLAFPLTWASRNGTRVNVSLTLCFKKFSAQNGRRGVQTLTMAMLKKIGRLFQIKTRLEAWLVIYAIALGAVERGRHYLEMYYGAPTARRAGRERAAGRLWRRPGARCRRSAGRRRGGYAPGAATRILSGRPARGDRGAQVRPRERDGPLAQRRQDQRLHHHACPGGTGADGSAAGAGRRLVAAVTLAYGESTT